MLVEGEVELDVVLRHGPLAQDRRGGVRDGGGSDDAEVLADGVGVAFGGFPTANFLEKPRQHAEIGRACGRGEHGGRGRGGIGGGVARAGGEEIAPGGGGGSILPAGGQVALPGPDELGESELELRLPRGADVERGVVGGDL